MADLQLKSVAKIYPGNIRALAPTSVEIDDGEFVMLVSPSGCGKSTLLRMIAGLEPVSQGEIHIGGRLVNDIPAKDRDIAMVFQNYALYPHMTVIAGFSIIPRQFTLESYRLVFRKIPITRGFINSLFVAMVVTASVIGFGSMVGYALSRLRFRGREMIFTLALVTMMIPAQLTLIPLYTMMVKFGWVNSYLALIVPAMMSSYAVLLFRQFFLSIPQSLIEAARLDGCSDWRILFTIVYPLSKPAIMTVAVLTFMGVWNDVLWPLMVIRDPKLMTMPLMVTLFAVGGQAEARLGVQLAAAMLLALPVIVAYMFLQRYLIESIASSGMKS